MLCQAYTTGGGVPGWAPISRLPNRLEDYNLAAWSIRGLHRGTRPYPEGYRNRPGCRQRDIRNGAYKRAVEASGDADQAGDDPSSRH